MGSTNNSVASLPYSFNLFCVLGVQPDKEWTIKFKDAQNIPVVVVDDNEVFLGHLSPREFHRCGVELTSM